MISVRPGLADSEEPCMSGAVLVTSPGPFWARQAPTGVELVLEASQGDGNSTTPKGGIRIFNVRIALALQHIHS